MKSLLLKYFVHSTNPLIRAATYVVLAYLALTFGLLLMWGIEDMAYGQILAPILQGAPSGGGGGKFTFVGGATACAGFSSSIVLSYSPTAGNDVFFGLHELLTGGDTGPTITLNGGSTATQDKFLSLAAGGDNAVHYWFHKYNVPSGTTTFTAAVNSGTIACISVAEFHDTSTPSLDKTDSTGAQVAFTANPAWGGASITPTAGNESLVMATGNDDNNGCTFTTSGSYTLATEGTGGGFTVHGGIVYRIVPSANTSYTPTGASSGCSGATAGMSIDYQ